MSRFRSVLVLTAILVVMLLGLASWLIQNRVAEDARASLGQYLNTVLETTHQAVKTWTREQQTAATVWAGTTEVRDAASKLLAVPATRDGLKESLVQAELRRWLGSVYAVKGYQGYFIIGPGNVNLASSRDANLGEQNLLTEQRGFLDRVWAGEVAVSLPLVSDVPLPDGEGRLHEGRPTMFAASPIRGNDGRVMAVLAFRIDPSGDFSGLFRQGRPGITGETYAFDARSRLITESRFDEQLGRIGLLPKQGRSLLNIELRDPGRALTETKPSSQSLAHQAMTSMARQSTSGSSGMDLNGYRDYRGVFVVGAWLWDESLGLGIASEMDASEAYGPLRTVQHVIAGLTALSALLLLGLTAAFVVNRGHILERKRRLRQIIDLVPSMIFAKDRDGRFLLANKAVAEAYGTTPEALIHASHQDIHEQAAEVQAMLADDREVIDSGRTKVIPEEHFLDAFGNRRILQTVKIPYEAVGHGQHAVLGVATDITARKRAEESMTQERDRAQQYLDIAGVMFVVIGADRRVSLINQRGCEVLGYEEADILGKDWFENFLPERMRLEVGRGFDSFMRDESEPMEYYENPVLTRSGDERLIAWHNTSVRDEHGRIVATLSSGEDVTERRKLEDRRNRFVSIASHELRTPLTNISLSLELLLREATPAISERARGMLDIARRSSERLTRVVNDLLDMQSLEAGKSLFHLKRIALVPLVEEAIESGRAYAKQFGVRYVLTSDPADVKVQGDSDRLIQVVTNLLSNAARFSPGGATVDVAVACREHRVRLSVTDRGPGIPGEFRELVFEPFAQAEPSLEDPRHKESSGLGLSISRAIIERHGGWIGFDSEPHVATTFYFELTEWADP